MDKNERYRDEEVKNYIFGKQAELRLKINLSAGAAGAVVLFHFILFLFCDLMKFVHGWKVKTE